MKPMRYDLADPDDHKPKTALNIVKLTAFEALAVKVSNDEKGRKNQMSLLLSIMRAYSYLTCVIGVDPRPVTLDEINSTIRHITLVVTKENERIKKSANSHTGFSIKAEYFPDSYIWTRTGYYKTGGSGSEILRGDARCPDDILFSQSLYWNEWKKSHSNSEEPLDAERLQRDLWDSERQFIKDYLLGDFIRHYPWVFPPNVVELHKEMVAREIAATV